MTIRVHLMAGEGRSATIDLSWEGEVELELSVGPVIRGHFLNMPTIVLKDCKSHRCYPARRRVQV